ncbi:MAG TPA: hypothetical protein VM925_00005, partial [Labilithrix sp.]|nr:hypothetical protein [Labilithrix sp.]
MAASLSLQATPFADEFVDVAELNAGVSSRVLSRIEAVREAARREERIASTAMTVLGPAGGGKTHLVGRVRQAAGAQATLVLVRPYFGVSLSLRDVLATTVDHLCRRPKGATLSQLDVVAAYWLAPQEGALFPTTTSLETHDLGPEARAAQVERAVVRVVERIPELAPVAHLVRALLGVGAREGAARWAELAWLSGREPRAAADGGAEPGAGVLGDGDVLHVLSILAILAAPIAPLVLVFDQLENLASEGEERVLGYGNLVSELVDSVSCLSIVQLALTSEWLQFIEPHLSLSQRSRVASDKLSLELPSEKQRGLLLRAWQDRLSPPASRTGRRKRLGHPLSDEQVKQLLTAPGVTPRLLATAYARALAGRPISDAEEQPASDRPVLASFIEVERARVESEIDEKVRANLPVDAAELAEGIAAALSFVPRLEVETRSERERFITTVRAPGGELVVLYLTSSHHSSVAAGLSRAAELARSTKVAVVREKRFDFPPSWATVEERRGEFERMPNARWLWLDRDEVVRCLSLARLSSLARSKRLREPGSEKPLALDRVRAEADQLLAPAGWSSSSSIERWLNDVPRDARAPSSQSSSQVDAPARTKRPEPASVEAVRGGPPAASPSETGEARLSADTSE